jgi:hypothetical protein
MVDPRITIPREGQRIGQHGIAALQGGFACAQMPPQVCVQGRPRGHEKHQQQHQNHNKPVGLRCISLGG